MVEDAIRDCSRRAGIILDPFLGSGTTIIAAERAGRRGFGIEIDPAYCDVTLGRVQEVCSLVPRLEATGQSFEQVTEERQDVLPEQNAPSTLGTPGNSGYRATQHPVRKPVEQTGANCCVPFRCEAPT
jgi:hypothetical protein